jgi:predicted dinucleotide-binding enzyme
MSGTVLDTTSGVSMKIAVLGTGKIGGTLGRAFARAGHDVTFGSREAGGETSAAGDGGPAVSDIPSAIGAADVVVLTLPGAAVAGLVREHGPALGGKLVVDATNKIGESGPANSHDGVTAMAPAVRYARAFNSLGFENLQDPRYGDVIADMFFSCPQPDRATLEQLIDAVGLRPVYLGDGAHALLDDVLRLWLTISRLSGQRHFAFKVVGDAAPPDLR